MVSLYSCCYAQSEREGVHGSRKVHVPVERVVDKNHKNGNAVCKIYIYIYICIISSYLSIHVEIALVMQGTLAIDVYQISLPGTTGM